MATLLDVEDEIDITPEMLDAGVGALMAWNPKFHGEDDCVIAIHKVMLKAAHQGAKAAPERC
jgi:hypothetical protein